MAISLQGRRILITDRLVGGLDLGTTLVATFPALGARVAFINCAVTPGETVEADATPGHFKANLLDQASVDSAVDSAVEWLGGLDVLVHCAQLAEPVGTAEGLTLETWNTVIHASLTGTFLVNQAVFRHLKIKGGAILNQTSTGGVIGAAGKGAFSAAKGGVVTWTRTIAAEWGKYRITANAVAPALGSKKYAEALAKLPPERQKEQEYLTKSVVVLGGERGDARADYAPIMAFLASEDAHHLTGQVIPIDGGWVMMR